MSTATETTIVKPRRAVLEMPEYHPPLAGRDALRLDFNENTIGCSPINPRRTKSRLRSTGRLGNISGITMKDEMAAM